MQEINNNVFYELDLDEFKKDLAVVLNKHNVSLGVEIECNTNEFRTLGFYVCDSHGDVVILNSYSACISSNDL